ELTTWGGWRNSRREYDLAAYAYETAAVMKPDNEEPLLWLAVGQNYRAAGEPQSALPWYERVLAIEPENESALSAVEEIEAASS
ncbi:MAG: tetratricopeptide repeat protein, partial [Anaerolineae bacterium]|nr:tetratricopeptide repeat protein [Anaerolineae bacterium]